MPSDESLPVTHRLRTILWVTDYTCVATWRGFVWSVFLVDVYARMISLEFVRRHLADRLKQAVNCLRKSRHDSCVHGVGRASLRLSNHQI
jgi:putative transposase